MRTSRLRVIALPSIAALVALSFVPSASGSASSEFFALVGQNAATFRLSADMRFVRALHLAETEVRYERYQQLFGTPAAEVVGGQVALYRDASGTIVSALGRRFPRITATNTVGAEGAASARRILAGLGAGANPKTRLMIDPSDGRFYHQIQDQRPTSRWTWWVDAETGAVLRHFNAVAYAHGTGVKGDTKDMNGNDANPNDDLTRLHSSAGHGQLFAHFDMISKDGRQVTYDCGNQNLLACPKQDVTDSDNHWTLVTADRRSPGHPAIVDAQFYANVTDDYLQTRHGFDFLSCDHAAMESVAHGGVEEDTAFWSGSAAVFGDGETGESREFSGALDVVSHEFSHGVIDCTSNLAIIFSESATLNESFSDAMAASAEFFANEPTSSQCVLASGQGQCADWWVGEDVFLVADTVPGFRNMADPAEDGGADHYSERDLSGSADATYVNAGISNHAYYLLVNGGANAGQARGHAHSGPSVTAIGLSDAERIWFLGFTGLPGATSTFCDARLATIAQAQALFGSGSQQKASTRDAWQAVGVTEALCGS